MTTTDQRDLVIPHYHAAMLREKIAVERAIDEERQALTATPEWARDRWHEYERICQRLDNATRDVAGLARALLELNDGGA